MKYNTIYDMIIAEEAAYALPITVIDGWEWSMKDHIKTSLFYKHGRLLTGNSDDKPVKNITRPILNLAYRAEDIDMKDINIYVDDSEKFHMSFLIKKYHDEVFVKENDLDTFFDEVKEEKIDFGGSLCKKVKGARPEKVALQSLAFCDQTDILSGPLAIKHNYSPDQLKEMESVGWGKDTNGATGTIDEVITLSRKSKTPDRQSGKENLTPGNYIEVYEVRGTLPDEWLEDNTVNPDEDKSVYTKQIQIVTFYKDEKDQKRGITLFKAKDKDNNLKFVSRDTIFGRALGFGGAEELFESQVWTNYNEIRKKDMLDAASKTIILAIGDPGFANRNKVKDMDNLEVVDVATGGDVRQMDTFPRNISLFNESIQEWALHAQQTGAANDAIMGKSPSAGTPFKLQELVTAEAHGLHEYRRGKYAKFIEEIYQDWIIPYISQEIVKGKKFLSELSQDEMSYVAECLIRSETSKFITEKMLNGEAIYPDEIEAIKVKLHEDFLRGGSKRFIEILKDEMKGITFKVKVNVAGKQKDLVGIVDKLTNIFRQVLASPQVLDDPRMAKIFNKIIEYSGLDPIDFTPSSYKPATPQQPNQTPNQPVKSPVQPNQLPVKQ